MSTLKNQSTPETPTKDSAPSADNTDALDFSFSGWLTSRSVLRSAAAGALILCSAVGYAAVHPEFIKDGLSVFHASKAAKPETAKVEERILYEVTYDSSEPDLTKRYQHRMWTIRGTQGSWKYTDPDGEQAGGVASTATAMNGSFGLLYGSKDADGPSLGAVFVRPLHLLSPSRVIWVGFETGHDCVCGDNMAHDGPFTSVPAILSTTPDIPANVQTIVFRSKAANQNFVWPEDVISALKAQGQDARKLD